MKQLDYILAHETDVLKFLKSRYPLYHLSNVFFRDVQYGIQTMLDGKSMSVGYADAEKIARAFVVQLEKKRTLNPIDQQSWVLNYPEFRKPAVAAPASAKPAAKPAAPAAAAPGGAKPSLPPLSRPAGGAAKTGGLPPLTRPAAGTAAGVKPGGLPPLKTPTGGTLKTTPSPAVATQAATPVPTATAPNVEAPKQGGANLPSAAPKPAAPGEKKPLPPLRSSTQAGRK